MKKSREKMRAIPAVLTAGILSCLLVAGVVYSTLNLCCKNISARAVHYSLECRCNETATHCCDKKPGNTCCDSPDAHGCPSCFMTSESGVRFSETGPRVTIPVPSYPLHLFSKFIPFLPACASNNPSFHRKVHNPPNLVMLASVVLLI